MKIRSLMPVIAALTLTGCDGLREALTAHVDVVARAETQELSVNRLADLLGNTRLQIPVNRETARIVADLWVNYHLLALAAARGDSLMDEKAIDEAAQGITANARLGRFMQQVSAGITADSASEATYNQAARGVLAARHILFAFPGGATQEQKDSVRRRAQSVRAQVTGANFAELARRHSADPGSANRGGDLGAFNREEMVKPFSDAVASLRPGEISNLVETQYGYHIVQRPTYAAARATYDTAFRQRSRQSAESLYIERVDSEAKIEVRSNAPALAKSAARDVGAHRRSDDVMATFRGGSLNVGEFVRWVESMNPQMRIWQQIPEAPDSVLQQFVRSVARNEVLLMRADSAGIRLTDEERSQLRSDFRGLIASLWQQLGVSPQSLADSARSQPERERLAASRAEAVLDRIMAGQTAPVSVPVPLQMVLAEKYTSRIQPAGVDRAVERGRSLRASADSARAASQPPPQSQVPLPAPAPPPDAAGGRRP